MIIMKGLFKCLLLCIFTVTMLTACDFIYPPGKIKVAKLEPIYQGTSFEIEIIYPNTGGTCVFGWKDQNIEIIEGDDIIEVSDLTITGLKPGNAKVKVSATTVLSEDGLKRYSEKIYSTELKIKVQ